MLKWFSISGIISEIRRIRWPKPKALARDTMTVIVFTLIFALFFAICTSFDAWFLKELMGI